MIAVNVDNIPSPLTRLPQWVNWRGETRDGKPTKVPYAARTGQRASSTDPTTWATFQEAIEAAPNYAGIGFVVSADDPFIGVDLDHCLDPETGALLPWAHDIVDRLHSYTEISPSGTGLRLFVRGSLPAGGRKKGPVEVYAHGRFLTMTGRHLEGTPFTIEERTAALAEFHTHYFPAATPSLNGHARPSAQPVDFDDRVLIEKLFAAKNGAKARTLWNGDWSAARYPSQSEADLGLIGELKFYTQDAGQLDRLFRSSGLMRDKWDARSGEQTYGERTIAKALAHVTEIYRPPQARVTTASAPGREPNESMPSEAPDSDLPSFPSSAYLGIADEIASLYAEHLEAPKEFLYIDALTFLGTLLTTSLRLDSELREEPRLYTVKVARSGLDRKSSSQDTMEHFFGPLMELRGVKICYGTGSAEGLQKVMEGSPSTLLVYDELRSFVDKACVQQSVLLPMVATLFHRTKYENCTKHSEIKLTDAHLSLVAACTQDTFMTMFSPQFRNIGFLNRLFVVTGRRTTRHPIPKSVPHSLITGLQDRVRRLVEQAGRERLALAFDADARDRWSEWYLALQDSPYAVRLDTYGLRFLMLFAASTGTWRITRTLVDAVIALLDYQFAVRKELDPVDAEGVVARMEQILLRHLSKGRMTESRLQALANVRHYGVWVYDIALKNVMGQDWVRVMKAGKGRQLWLTEQGHDAVSQ